MISTNITITITTMTLTTNTYNNAKNQNERKNNTDVCNDNKKNMKENQGLARKFEPACVPVLPACLACLACLPARLLA